MEVSCIFVVHNEEHRLRAALEAVRPFVDEIIVVDQGSTDGTAAIAFELADEVAYEPRRGFCEASIAFAESLCEAEWVIRLDADEVLDREFGIGLRALCASTNPLVDGYGLRRMTTIDGAFQPDGLSHHLRLWRRGSARHSGKIHTNAVVDVWHNDDRMAIIHAKTRAEQDLDDAKYATIPGGGP